MQFSFIFITALVAAVSATPVPQDPQKPTQVYQVDAPSGGIGGDEFSDLGMLQDLSGVPTITSFGGRGGARVDQVSLVGFVNVTTNLYNSTHGGDGGTATELLLPAGEWIQSMDVQIAVRGGSLWGALTTGTSVRVFYIKVITNLGHWAEVGTHSDDGRTISYSPPTGYTHLVGFSGRQGANLDRIGPIWG